jgi:hypothetical protein
VSGGLYGDGITINHSTHLTSNAYPLANGDWIYKNSSQVAQRYSMESNGAHAWFTAPSGTAGNAISFGDAKMTLDASGNLGIGTNSPTFGLGTGLQIAGAGYAALSLKKGSAGTGHAIDMVDSSNTLQFRIGTNFAGGGNNLLFAYGTTPTIGMMMDSSGNLGLGVTPSAWWSAIKPLQMSGNGFVGSVSNQTYLGANFFYDSSANPVYVASAAASLYEQATGAHKWYTAPSGTAGNAISFTQAMTLDASGNLGVGTTAAAAKFAVSDGGANGFEFNPNSSGTAQLETYNRTTSAYVAFRINADDVRLHTGASATERVRVKSTGQVRFVPLAADPSGAEAGDVYYNSGTNKLRLYDGSTWVDLN